MFFFVSLNVAVIFMHISDTNIGAFVKKIRIVLPTFLRYGVWQLGILLIDIAKEI